MSNQTDNTTTQPALEACPCCAWLTQLLHDAFCFPTGSTGGWQLRCDKCGLQTCWWHSKEEAYKAWNSRVSASAAPTANFKVLAQALWTAFWTDLCSDKWSVDDIERVLRAAAASLAAPQDEAKPFQDRVQPWMLACFGEVVAGDKEERNHRFLEEALELVQSCDMTRSEAHQLVDYTFNRPADPPQREVGGVMVTLAALCLAQGLDMHECGEAELSRVWTKIDVIRAKQAAKPKHSPLPEHVAAAKPSGAQGAAREIVRDHLAPCADCFGDAMPDVENAIVKTINEYCFSAAAAPVLHSNWQYTHERDADLIRRDGMMCEAHPGLEFEHDPDCAGPGMAWVVEGKEAVKLFFAAAPEFQPEPPVTLNGACFLCEKGFPIQGGIHYGTQSLGMIPSTLCSAASTDPNFIPVTCSTCDPPSIVYVRKGTSIDEPYVCTVCQKRALRRMENATSPHVGRMKHGESK